MVIACNILFLLSKDRKLLLDIHEHLRHCVRILAVTHRLYCIRFLDDALDQQILHDLSRRLIIRLEVGTHMPLGLIDSSDDLPLALMQTISADKPLVFTLPVKDADLQ